MPHLEGRMLKICSCLAILASAHPAPWPCGPRGDPPQVQDAQMVCSADFSDILKKSALSKIMSRTVISTSLPGSAQPSGPLQKRRESKATGWAMLLLASIRKLVSLRDQATGTSLRLA